MENLQWIFVVFYWMPWSSIYSFSFCLSLFLCVCVRQEVRQNESSCLCLCRPQCVFKGFNRTHCCITVIIFLYCVYVRLYWPEMFAKARMFFQWRLQNEHTSSVWLWQQEALCVCMCVCVVCVRVANEHNASWHITQHISIYTVGYNESIFDISSSTLTQEMLSTLLSVRGDEVSVAAQGEWTCQSSDGLLYVFWAGRGLSAHKARLDLISLSRSFICH